MWNRNSSLVLVHSAAEVAETLNMSCQILCPYDTLTEQRKTKQTTYLKKKKYGDELFGLIWMKSRNSESYRVTLYCLTHLYKGWICLISLVVVEILWDKSPQINIFSFFESVHSTTPSGAPEKSLHELLLGKTF